MKGIVFDMDGTLTDTNELYARAYIDGFEKAGVNIRGAPNLEKKMWDFYGLRPEEIVRRVLTEAGIDATREREVLGLVFREMERVLSEREVLYPGVREMLARLKRDHVLGLVTGSPRRVARAAMKDMLELFDSVVCGDEDIEWKPSPRPLVECARRMGVPPGECAYVGDTVVDMRAARSAGMVPVGVLTGPCSRSELEKAGARIVIESASVLPSVLEVLK